MEKSEGCEKSREAKTRLFSTTDASFLVMKLAFCQQDWWRGAPCQEDRSFSDKNPGFVTSLTPRARA
jgi:hypothetical protein